MILALFMHSILLFILYYLLLLWVLWRIVVKCKIPVGFGLFAAIFSFKVLAGACYGFIYLHYYHGDDTWMLFADSVEDTRKLTADPILFLNDLLPGNAFANGFFHGWEPYMTSLEYWLFVKMLAIFNLFSRGNYYIDVLFFESLVCFGPLILFKWLLSYFPGRRALLIILLFFVPSFAFWLSGLRAEGLLFLFIAWMFYYADQWLDNRKGLSWLMVLAGGIGFMIFRGQGLIVFLPAFLCWFLCRSYLSLKPHIFFALVYLAGALLIIGSMVLSPEKNPAHPIVARQQAFMRLHGDTRFLLDSLHPNPGSFLRVFPQAFANGFLRPYIWEPRGFLQILTAIETLVAWCMVLLCVLRPYAGQKNIWKNPLILCFLFFGVSQILLIGYVVPFPGAIVRYRAIPGMFLVIALGLVMRPLKIKLYKI